MSGVLKLDCDDQNSKFTESHWTGPSKRVNFTVCKLQLNNAVLKKSIARLKGDDDLASLRTSDVPHTCTFSLECSKLELFSDPLHAGNIAGERLHPLGSPTNAADASVVIQWKLKMLSFWEVGLALCLPMELQEFLLPRLWPSPPAKNNYKCRSRCF